jgi:Secretion system C-terminal sorting domain
MSAGSLILSQIQNTGMKKLYILTIALGMSMSVIAQKRSAVAETVTVVNKGVPSFNGGANLRTTAVGDTVTLYNIPDTATITLYKLGTIDSGYVTGTNYWGDKAFAERYVNDSGNIMQVIGVVALFGGHVNPASTTSIMFKIWDQGANEPITATRFYNGFPNNVLTSLSVPFTHLGIGTTADTIKSYFFANGTTGITGSFFAGYSMNYSFSALSGDLIGLTSSANGERLPVTDFSLAYHVSDFGDTVLDTVINVQNATMWADNTWHDNYTDNDSIKNNLAIYPIVVLGFPTSVKGITKNNFTFYGNYPNPVESSTNFKLSLAAGADVNIQIMDMSGRVISTTNATNLSAGEHVIALNTVGLAAGEYLYLIRTSQGDGIAGKMVK